MITLSVFACLLGAGDKVPPPLELFAKEAFYKEQPGKEQDFVGVLKKAERKGGVGFGRFNPYRLEMDKDTREVYVGGKPDVLKAYVGSRVRITGKPVDMEVEGSKHREIWPARLEVIAGDKEKKSDGKKEDASGVKVYGETKANFGLRGHQVIRSAEELAKARGAKDADKATQDLAKQLKVENIDWKKQMVLMVSGGTQRSGGFSVELLNLAAKDKELLVRWKLNTPAPGRPVTLALTNPSLTLLVDRFDGEVHFDPPAPKSKLDR